MGFESLSWSHWSIVSSCVLHAEWWKFHPGTLCVRLHSSFPQLLPALPYYIVWWSGFSHKDGIRTWFSPDIHPKRYVLLSSDQHVLSFLQKPDCWSISEMVVFLPGFRHLWTELLKLCWNGLWVLGQLFYHGRSSSVAEFWATLRRVGGSWWLLTSSTAQWWRLVCSSALNSPQIDSELLETSQDNQSAQGCL